jgi:hypothetical protein
LCDFLSALNEPFEFPVRYVYILQRSHDDDTLPFHIAYQIPLGSVLEPIHSKQLPLIDSKLIALFQTMNLYPDEVSHREKHDKLKRLSLAFQSIFNEDTAHCFTHEFLPYGSFRIVSVDLSETRQ